MIDALKLVTIERGHDPRDLSLVVTGGAGPLLAANLGRELRVRSTIVPIYPGIFSAWGMLAALPRIDLRRTLFGRVDETTFTQIRSGFDTLMEESQRHFGVVDTSTLSFGYYIEARYRGQEHSVTTDFEPDWSPEQYLTTFHTAHKRAYTFESPNTPVEITTIHLQAEQVTDLVQLVPVDTSGRSLASACTARRSVYIDETSGRVDCPVYDREQLPVNEVVPGPALIEELTSTTLVLPNQTLMLNGSGLILIRELQ